MCHLCALAAARRTAVAERVETNARALRVAAASGSLFTSFSSSSSSSSAPLSPSSSSSSSPRSSSARVVSGGGLTRALSFELGRGRGSGRGSTSGSGGTGAWYLRRDGRTGTARLRRTLLLDAASASSPSAALPSLASLLALEAHNAYARPLPPSIPAAHLQLHAVTLALCDADPGSPASVSLPSALRSPACFQAVAAAARASALASAVASASSNASASASAIATASASADASTAASASASVNAENISAEENSANKDSNVAMGEAASVKSESAASETSAAMSDSDIVATNTAAASTASAAASAAAAPLCLKPYAYRPQRPLFETAQLRRQVVHTPVAAAHLHDYCAECLQRAPLGRSVACQGQCARVWHAHCRPRSADAASSSSVAASSSSEDAASGSSVHADADSSSSSSWLCPDCVAGVQACFVCKHASRPGEQIFPCSSGCGLHYHPGCMEVWFQSQVQYMMHFLLREHAILVILPLHSPVHGLFETELRRLVCFQIPILLLMLIRDL